MVNHARHAACIALAAAVAAGDEAVARRALPPSDPLVRWLARRRVGRALRHAWLEAGSDGSADEVEQARHTLRVAYLHVAGDEGGAMDRASVADRYAAVRTRPPIAPPRRPLPTLALLTVLLAASALVGWAAWPIPGPHEGPVGQALTEHLPEWVVALGQARSFEGLARTGVAFDEAVERLDRLEGRVLDATVREAIGAEAASGLAELMAGCRATSLDGAPVTLEGPLRRANEGLRAAGQPYFLDATVLFTGRGAAAAILTYGVERSVDVQAGGETVWVAHVRRLDGLNLDHDVFGYTSRAMPAALVRLDALEDWLVNHVGPALAPDAPLSVFSWRETDYGDPWQNEVRARAGEVARAALAPTVGDRAAEVAELGRLLAERRRLLSEWRIELRDHGVSFTLPGTLALGEGDWAFLDAAVGESRADMLRSVQWDIERSEVARRLLDAMARATERHEVQHRLDFVAGRAEIPALLLGISGLSLGPNGRAPRRLQRVAEELSAYTAQLADSGPDLMLEVTQLLHLVLARRPREVYRTAAAALLEGLAEELALDASLLDGSYRVRKRRAARLYLALTEHEPDAVRLAARKLWKRWYGEEVDRARRE